MTLFGGWDGATNIFNSVLKLTPDGVAGEGVVCCWVPPPPPPSRFVWLCYVVFTVVLCFRCSGALPKWVAEEVVASKEPVEPRFAAAMCPSDAEVTSALVFGGVNASGGARDLLMVTPATEKSYM